MFAAAALAVAVACLSCPAASANGRSVEDVAAMRAGAEAGQAAAQYWYGLYKETEAGAPAEAAGWYRRAAAQGHQEAELRLAQMLERAVGILGDPAEARRLYTRAAEAGVVVAQFNLAVMLEEGRGGDRDLEAAGAWYHAAALQGHGRAANNLATMLAKGEGVEADREAALRWYRIAAQRGVDDALYNLGVLYLSEPYRDVASAQAWLGLAAARAGGHVAALARAGLKALEPAMTPELMQQAKQLEADLKRSL
jgi:TPR repeat protein